MRTVLIDENDLDPKDVNRLHVDVEKSNGKFVNVNCIDIPGWASSYLIYHGIRPYRFLTVCYDVPSARFLFSQDE